MGMFDSFYDAAGNEWQTKAFALALDVYRIGDHIPAPLETYQVEVFGGERGAFVDSYATVCSGVLTKVPDERDEGLQLVPYSGPWPAETKGD